MHSRLPSLLRLLGVSVLLSGEAWLIGLVFGLPELECFILFYFIYFFTYFFIVFLVVAVENAAIPVCI